MKFKDRLCSSSQESSSENVAAPRSFATPASDYF